MSRPLQSQWDFSSSEKPAAPARKIFTVGELTSAIRKTLESSLGILWVTGELTNCRVQASGHCYFTIKDPFAQLSCVLFRTEVKSFDRSLIIDGQKVTLQGELTVYETRGQYQLRVTNVELEGQGALQLAFEKLKLKLQQEGLFETARKRAIPSIPQRIGLVTSIDGAALRDVLHVIERRFPGLQIVIASCRVQGMGAADEIACAIALLNDWSKRPQSPLDAILVTRGGGSMEDLWAFNEEVVARAIFNSSIPVISAVGHEIDFTISDFVADLRAATPSAAAELLTQGAVMAREFIFGCADRFSMRVRRGLLWAEEDLANVQERLARMHPKKRLQEQEQILDDLRFELARSVRTQIEHLMSNQEMLTHRFTRLRPELKIKQLIEQLHQLTRQLNHQVETRIGQFKADLAFLKSQCELLSPNGILSRGYSITINSAGEVIRNQGHTRPGEKIVTKLANGTIHSEVLASCEGPVSLAGSETGGAASMTLPSTKSDISSSSTSGKAPK